MSEHDPFLNDSDENEPEIWDEHQWEEFFQESDKQTEKFSELLDKYKDHPDCDRIIAEEMGWTHLPGNSDDEFDLLFGDSTFYEYEEGEDWKALTNYEPTDFNHFEDLPLYQLAYAFTLEAMNLVEEHFSNNNDESVKKFARSIIIPPAKIAGGFSLGFDQELIGGNIANCKRGLNAANRILDALFEIGEKELLENSLYLEIYERAKEVRDELAIYIVEMRERFNRGFS